MSEEEKIAKLDNEEEDDGDNGPAVEEESTATFIPVVKLDIVEVKTMEEDEEVEYKQRGKLFLFGETMLDKGTGNKTWKERGIGDIKLLRHKDTGRIRVLMRQEKTMKIIVNHFLDPRIVLVPNAGSDKSWCWIAYDFAEQELIETTFAIRFSTIEIAQEFKTAFLKGQEEMIRLLNGSDIASANEVGAPQETTSEVNNLTEAVEVLKVAGALEPESKAQVGNAVEKTTNSKVDAASQQTSKLDE